MGRIEQLQYQNESRTRILSRFREWVKGGRFFMRYLYDDTNQSRNGGKIPLVLLVAVPLFIFFFALYASVPRFLESSTSPVEKWMLSLHISGATMGQLLAFLSSGISVAFLWQNNRLKKKRWQPMMMRLPSLELLGELLRASLWTGFAFLTLALLSGACLIWFFPLLAPHLPHSKILWASLVWGWYLVLLLARERGHLPLLLTARLSLVGFCLLVVVFFVLSFLLWGS